jgi:hypothetical protein
MLLVFSNLGALKSGLAYGSTLTDYSATSVSGKSKESSYSSSSSSSSF